MEGISLSILPNINCYRIITDDEPTCSPCTMALFISLAAELAIHDDELHLPTSMKITLSTLSY